MIGEVTQIGGGQRRFSRIPEFPELQPLEQRVAMMLVDDGRPEWIANVLGISGDSVSTAKSRLLQKLGVDTVAGLTRLAIRRGYIQP